MRILGLLLTGLLMALPYQGFAANRSVSHSERAYEILPLIRHFDAKLPKLMKQLGTPGAAIAIVYKGEIIYVKPFGTKKIGTNARINGDTLFQLGSVSKPFAAALASSLATQKHFTLDDNVERYLPKFGLREITQARPGTLKIRNLLSHTSGVPRAGFNRLIESYQPYQKILQKLQMTQPNCAIGSCYDYHNVAFSLIGDVIESTTRLSFEQALDYYFLKPLNMRRTTANFSSLMQDPNKAYPHIKDKRGRITSVKSYSRGYYTVAPAGGINSSIRDMAVFLQAQLGHHPLVLNRRAIDEMLRPQIATPEIAARINNSHVKTAHYGLGWRILNFAQEKMVFHGGWLKGFNNVIAFMPEHEVGIVVLQNAETRFSWAATTEFFELFLKLPQEKKVHLKKRPALKKRKSHIIQAKRSSKTANNL